MGTALMSGRGLHLDGGKTGMDPFRVIDEPEPVRERSLEAGAAGRDSRLCLRSDQTELSDGITGPESPRAALDRAWYFLAQAERTRGDRRTELGYNLEAAIVFGRAVYHRLQYRAEQGPDADPSYRAWFRAKKEAMSSDQVLEYFRHQRDLTLKQRDIIPVKRVPIQGSVHGHSHVFADLTAVRERPWYRRSPRTLWLDFLSLVLRPAQRGRDRAAFRVEEMRAAVRSRRDRVRQWWERRRYVPSVRDYYLDDPEGCDRSAVDLVREYLNRLDKIVAEADRLPPASVD